VTKIFAEIRASGGTLRFPVQLPGTLQVIVVAEYVNSTLLTMRLSVNVVCAREVPSLTVR
jgi:hypothetical protein